MTAEKPLHCRTVVLRAVARLAQRDRDAEVLHRLRTHLRRLQAYLELVGQEANAEIIAGFVSCLSKLRTLHVLERYLSKREAPRSDRKTISRLILARQKKIMQKDLYRKIERGVRCHALPPAPANPDWLAQRLRSARHANAEALRELVVEATAKPRRKVLHRMRLRIKAIRYQEEWALGQPYARPDLVRRLKHAQSVLGDYEELVQFRKLARRLGLKSLPVIRKDLRRARKRARALVPKLILRVDDLAARHLHMVPPPSRETAS